MEYIKKYHSMLWSEIPEFSKYIISTNKEVMNKITGNIISQHQKDGKGRIRVMLTRDDGGRRKNGKM